MAAAMLTEVTASRVDEIDAALASRARKRRKRLPAVTLPALRWRGGAQVSVDARATTAWEPPTLQTLARRHDTVVVPSVEALARPPLTEQRRVGTVTP